MTQLLHSWWWWWFFSFPKCSQQLWGAPSLQFNVQQGLLVVKLLEHKPDHSPYSAEIRYEWILISTPHMPSWHAKGHPYPHLITLQSHQRPNPSNITTSECAQISVKSFIYTGYLMICYETANIKRLIAEVSLIGAFIFCTKVQNI